MNKKGEYLEIGPGFVNYIKLFMKIIGTVKGWIYNLILKHQVL